MRAVPIAVNCTFCHALEHLVSECAAAHDRLEWFADDARGERRLSRNAEIALSRQSVRAARRQPKDNCGTCHQGVSKPLYGQSK
ncbi:photosynthetic reaction center cytochrome c subunit family protein [Methylocystis sp.]|uniref:photosynthetic reaction center cytochrome c subunit family protein n=1 Tax=Methylocystis sp. TaxID=1911079 RepID=UPI003DA20D66